MSSLKDEYDALSKRDRIPKEIQEYITANLNQNFELREYQKEAVVRLNFNYTDSQRVKPTQLLFEMATGSGKTLIMAANILFLYQQGYRNFVFFVNNTNIVEKTKANFLDALSSKYLFNKNRIEIDGKEVKVKEVENFEVIDPDAINIFFTTIQGLHSLMNYVRENSITYEDLKNKKIVIISDEAHHINAWTRNGATQNKNDLNQGEQEAKRTWEETLWYPALCSSR